MLNHEMNVGMLKSIIKELPDDMPVFVSCQGYSNFNFCSNEPWEDEDTFGIVHNGKLFITDSCGELWDSHSEEHEELLSYIEVASKLVRDFDGFLTDYTMYKCVGTEDYVFIFGDKELYRPESEDFDWSCDSEQEAWEWFNSYVSFNEDDE